MTRPDGDANGENSARAFGEGSDARLAGLPLDANPHSSLLGAYGHWRRGWDHVATEWGADAKWPVEALPPVGS